LHRIEKNVFAQRQAEGLNNSIRNSPHSHFPQLFMLKLWRVEGSDGAAEWRGQVQHISSREIRYFREWGALLEFVQAQLQLPRDDDFLLSAKKSDSE
jgi:hypothetical protein